MDLDLTLGARIMHSVRIARDAGAMALEQFYRREHLHRETKGHPADLVTDADRAVESQIRSELAAAFPDDGLLGEEHGLKEGSSGLTWVIDPIDGTSPFLAGLPGWCISLAACDSKGPLLGIVHAPVLGELYVAARGCGATLNGARIKVRGGDLRSAPVGLGFNNRVSPRRTGQMVAELDETGARWLHYGSGALMLAWVAAGKLIGYAEPRMQAWDCMAGYCLVREAGGRILDFPGDEGMTLPAPVVAAAPSAFDELLAVTRLNDPDHWSGGWGAEMAGAHRS